MRPNTADYRDVLLSGVPLLDVRAPVEFGKGAFPQAHNLPLLTDHERQQVGTCYKRRGQDAAIALGQQLVSGSVKAGRLAAWADFARQYPEGYLYCFRGGLRSRTVQQWLASEAGIDYPLVIGGYKALRHYLITVLDTLMQEAPLMVLGGLTGTGKTAVLAPLPQALDLEALAHHRGSSFGARALPQPTPIDFEHQLTLALLRRAAQGHRTWVVEDEGRCIGQCAIPPVLYQRMQSAPLVWLEEDFEHRVTRILHDYVKAQGVEYQALHGAEEGYTRFATQLQNSLHTIRKRLGHERCERVLGLMQNALAQQQRSGELEAHRAWIAALLREYYDPMYRYQEEQKISRIVFRGDHAAVSEFLQSKRAA